MGPLGLNLSDLVLAQCNFGLFIVFLLLKKLDPFRMELRDFLVRTDHHDSVAEASKVVLGSQDQALANRVKGIGYLLDGYK